MTTALRQTYADLMALPDDDNLHELVRGEIIVVPPPHPDHRAVEAALVGAVDRYVRDRADARGWQPSQGRAARSRLVGSLASGEAGIRFSLPDDPDQVRGADLLYLSADQFTPLEAVIWTQYVPEMPVLVAEVNSLSQSAAYSNEKVTDYLQGRATLVWQLFPRTRTIRVYTAENTTWTIDVHGTLEGGTVLPGFSVAVAELFA
jgi:Uma2 family endonuclease